MKYKLRKPDLSLKTSIVLPASKSISNRLLIIQALGGFGDTIQNLSESDDTRYMVHALNSKEKIIDIGHAGTTMRFLTAYYSCQAGNVQLTGSSRMKERPIGPLVNALNILGAKIWYLKKNGFPPIEIEGRKLKGGEITIESNISSQFISALLMTAPTMSKGLKLKLKGDRVSASYISMTLELMAAYGIEYQWDGDLIKIQPGKYRKTDYNVESDWSAASYWYALGLLDPYAEIHLSNLKGKSLQGDSALVAIFANLGLKSEFEGENVRLINQQQVSPDIFEYDFTDSPDIVQSMAVSLCLAGIPFKFTGTKTLRIKETDRISALQQELKKLGFILESDAAASFLAWNKKTCTPEQEPVIETYHDHRMAMAFAPVALDRGEVLINDPMVVSKSYPAFWDDLKLAGFKVDIL